jgi:muramidase (phage lysozyme)
MLRIGIALLIVQILFIYLNVPLKPINSAQEVKSTTGTNVESSVISNTGYRPGYDITTRNLDPRVKAFLNLIAYAEGTAGPRGYYMQYTGVHFTDDSKHPDQVICAWATVHGIRRRLCSSAAGRYQYITPTWNRVAKKGNLPDFSPTSQDAGAIILLKERGSYDYLLKRETPSRKDIERAIYLSREEWASLPGSPHGQPTKALNVSLDKYFEYLEYYKGKK